MLFGKIKIYVYVYIYIYIIQTYIVKIHEHMYINVYKTYIMTIQCDINVIASWLGHYKDGCPSTQQLFDFTAGPRQAESEAKQNVQSGRVTPGDSSFLL